MKVGDVVLIEWEDSCQTTRWSSDQPTDVTYVCWSAGHLVLVGKKVVAVAGSWHSATAETTDSRTGVMYIPVSAIRSKKVLLTAKEFQR